MDESMEHLSPEALRALESGDARVREHFARHLAEDCETCEHFLAQCEGPGLLDGQVDRLLLSLAPPAERPLDEVGFARIRRGMRAPGLSRRWVGVSVGALSACLLAVVLVQRGAPGSGVSEPGASAPGIKAQAPRMELELSVAARDSEGALRRLDMGDQVPEQDVLLLRYHATEAGTALLYQQSGAGEPQLLGRFALQAGTHDLAGEAGLAGVGLQGERGPVRLLLVGVPADSPVQEEQVRAALTADPSGEAGLGLHVSRFDLQVRSGENAR
jgi:hypothetical protein